MEFKGSWDTHLALMEFDYNNSYQANIELAPFEALYGRKCRTLVCWDEVGGRRLIGPEFMQITSEKVKVVRDNLKTARDRQKSYVDNRRRDLQFEKPGLFEDFPFEGCFEIWKARQAQSEIYRTL